MKTQRTLWWTTLVVLFLITFALRMCALESVPPGLTHDEASNGHDSAAILRGVHRIYFPVGYGHEPLYDYSVAALTYFLGQSIFTLRTTTVLWSLLTWILTVALARRWWGRTAATFTAAALTAGFWPLMMARIGLRAPVLPALLAASALAYDHALTADTSHRARRGYVLAGVFLGASFYTYMASRGMPALYLVFLLALALTDRARLHATWKGTLTVLIVAGLTGYPLFRYLHLHPELEQRIAQLGSALTALTSGDLRPLWANVTASLPMLLWRADPRWLYNIGGRPALEPLLAAAFLAGVGRALARLRDHRSLFVLIWLSGGLAPALLTTVEYNTLHAIAALPPVFLLTGYGFDALLRYAQQIMNHESANRRIGESRITNHESRIVGLPSMPSRSAPGLRQHPASRFTHHASRITFHVSRFTFYILLLTTTRNAAHAYFVTWGQNRDVRVNYHHHVVALGRHLDAASERTPVVITSIYPGEFHDPYTLEVTLRREDLALRWSDGRGALFFPRGETRLYTETLSAPLPALRPFIEAYASPATTLTFRPDDLPTAVYGYTWDADAAWNALSADLSTTVYVAPGDPPPGAPHVPAPCPVTFGDAVSLIGHRTTPPAPHPGDAVEVLTAWEVRAAHPAELVLFTHLLDDTGTVITQIDRLDAPAWQWQPGDRFAQVHTLDLPATLPPGRYHLAIGLYTRAGLTRLPVNTPPGPVTRVLIPLEVTLQ